MDVKIWGRKYSYREREPLNFPRRPLSMEISLVIDPKCTEAHMLKKKKKKKKTTLIFIADTVGLQWFQTEIISKLYAPRH